MQRKRWANKINKNWIVDNPRLTVKIEEESERSQQKIKYVQRLQIKEVAD
jgi:hypothetical protein